MSVRLTPLPPKPALVVLLVLAGFLMMPLFGSCGGGGSSGSTPVEVPMPPQPLEMFTDALPTASVGKGYLTQIRVAGGTPPYIFQVIGQLPPGLVLNQAGNIGGVATTAGRFTFSIRVDDSGASFQRVERFLAIEVVAGTDLPVIGTTSVPASVLNSAYAFQLQASGGTSPYLWSAQGILPPGISLNPQGLLAGTPLAVGTFSFTAVVRDQFQLIGSQDLMLGVLAVAPAGQASVRPEADVIPDQPQIRIEEFAWGRLVELEMGGLALPEGFRLRSGEFEWAVAGGLLDGYWLEDPWLMVRNVEVVDGVLKILLSPDFGAVGALLLEIEAGGEVFTYSVPPPAIRG